jgi:hypothetical protein
LEHQKQIPSEPPLEKRLVYSKLFLYMLTDRVIQICIRVLPATVTIVPANVTGYSVL